MNSITCKSHPGKTLTRHIEEIKEIFNKLLDFYNINKDSDLKNLIEKVIELHDIGKCRKLFQEYIERLESGQKIKSPGNHSLWSLEDLYEMNIYLKKELLPLLFFLIAKHHSNLTLEFKEEFSHILGKLIAKFYYNYYGDLKKESIEKYIKEKIIRKEISIEDAKELYYILNDLSYGKLKDFYKKYLQKFGKEFLINLSDFYGLFKISDILSAKDKIDYIRKIIKKEDITENKVKSLIDNIDEKRWEIQKNISNYNYLILRAPTGWGKTTISLLFAVNKDYRRIFITLPTITAIQKFYKKLKNNLNVEMYFYFYDALLFIEDEIDERINTLFYIQNLYSPINITTVDQILLTFLQTGKYFLKRVNLRNSILILDEVHLLTPNMLFLLKKFIEHFASFYNIRFLLMSATVPKGIAEYLSENIKFETIDIYGLWNSRYFSEEYYNRERFEFKLIDKDILEDLDRIIEENKNNKSILVIVNTVEKAVAIYKKLREDYKIKNILLLHGRFMFRDRIKKEKKIEKLIKNKGIFISTQVSEVSLDIDFDVLFTEAAPIASIVQRAGRVNRYGIKPKTNIYIYYPSELKELKKDEKKGYPYKINEIKKTWKFLGNLDSYKEGELIKKIDEEFTKEYYENLIKKEKIHKIYEEVFENRNNFSNVHWFLSSTSEEKGKELLDFRENITTLIIPYGDLLLEENLRKDINRLLEEYKILKEENADYEKWRIFFAKIKSYATPVPIWIISNIKVDNKYAFPILESLPEDMNYKYSKKYGFIDIEKLKKLGITIEDENFY